MARNVFDTRKKYRVTLWGHAFNLFPQAEISPRLPGRFDADTIELSGQQASLCGCNEYAVFTVDLPQDISYPASWAGRYLIPMSRIRESKLEEV